MGCSNPRTIVVAPAIARHVRFPDRFSKARVVRCGQCWWCRWMNALAWAVRIANEASATSAPCSFLTLTYSPEHLPKADKYPDQGTLVKKHLQDFIKRLRSRLEYYDGIQIRFFGCGEYGDKNGRAHYHVIVFGFGFPDRRYLERSKSGFPVYSSELLSSCWKYGRCTVQDVDVGVAKYVGQYSSKKITGEKAPEFYQGRLPEFVLNSLKPGIGAIWYERNKHWLWREEGIIPILVNGKYQPFYAPRYYEILFEREDPEAYARWKRDVRPFRNWEDVKGRFIVSGSELPDEFEEMDCD